MTAVYTIAVKKLTVLTVISTMDVQDVENTDWRVTLQALQYLRKVCNHPALVVKAGHPDHDRLVAQLRAQGSQLRDLQHAPKLGALK